MRRRVLADLHNGSVPHVEDDRLAVHEQSVPAARRLEYHETVVDSEDVVDLAAQRAAGRGRRLRQEVTGLRLSAVILSSMSSVRLCRLILR